MENYHEITDGPNKSGDSNCFHTQNTEDLASLKMDMIKAPPRWTKDEDIKLINAIKSFRDKNEKIRWAKVALIVDNKTPRQCNSRYNQMNPKHKKGNWTKEEHLKIESLAEKYGANYKLIALEVKNRSSKQIRDHLIHYQKMREKKVN